MVAETQQYGRYLTLTHLLDEFKMCVHLPQVPVTPPESGLVDSGAGGGIEIKDVTGIRAETHRKYKPLASGLSRRRSGKERDPALQLNTFRSNDVPSLRGLLNGAAAPGTDSYSCDES